MPRFSVSLPLVLAIVAGAAVPAALQARPSGSTGAIAVMAGAPHELSFTVSPSRITSSIAVFKVLNKGKLPHSFKVCAKPSGNAKANSCTGVTTKVLVPGASASLTVTFAASGTYEYVAGSASQAASGMKGLVTVSLSAASSTGSSSTSGSTGSSSSSTPKSSGSGTSSGGVVNGAATDPACPAGTTVPVGPGAGDQDDDNEGGFPTDGDGCV